MSKLALAYSISYVSRDAYSCRETYALHGGDTTHVILDKLIGSQNVDTC